MAKFEYSQDALADIERLVDYLIDVNLEVALEAFNVIDDGVRLLTRHPEIGRQLGGGKRELVISRGRTGYIAIYAFDKWINTVAVLAIKHQREDLFN
jgi:plasmid stabilization system protein ParE